jgi:hypothetical protein
MNRLRIAGLCAISLASSLVLSAQIQLPSAPPRQFGASITGAYEGWFDNPDGTHSFLVGYYNRNTVQELDIPIGPNNRIEPGGPDVGQPTHFLPGRHTGMFVVTVPKEFTKEQRYTWTLTANGVTNSIPLRLLTDYNISPFSGLEINNTPPSLRLFDEKAMPIQGPIAAGAKAVAKTATVSAGLSIPFWANDDAKYSTGTGAPLARARPPVAILLSKYRGPGEVTFDKDKPELQALVGGAVNEPYSGKGTAMVKFAAPGDYMIHFTANDYSGNGGGGEQCCWTTALVKVTVTP